MDTVGFKRGEGGVGWDCGDIGHVLVLVLVIRVLEVGAKRAGC